MSRATLSRNDYDPVTCHSCVPLLHCRSSLTSPQLSSLYHMHVFAVTNPLLCTFLLLVLCCGRRTWHTIPCIYRSRLAHLLSNILTIPLSATFTRFMLAIPIDCCGILSVLYSVDIIAKYCSCTMQTMISRTQSQGTLILNAYSLFYPSEPSMTAAPDQSPRRVGRKWSHQAEQRDAAWWDQWSVRPPRGPRFERECV